MEGAEEAFVESVEDPIMGEGLQEEQEEPVARRGPEGIHYAIMGNKNGHDLIREPQTGKSFVELMLRAFRYFCTHSVFE